MRHKLAMLADGTITPEALSSLVHLQERVAEQVAKSAAQHLSALETSDREDAVGDWLEDHGIDGGWDIAPTFVEGGVDADWLERISAVTDALESATLEQAIRWINYTIESVLLMNQILEASKRISALVADAKQYSQLDRAPFQVANVHDLLHSTLVMFADRLTKDGSKDGPKDTPTINLVKDWDRSLPEIPCYPGDLNQVWTNIIDNALAAMRDTGGTLTVRTAATATTWPASKSVTPVREFRRISASTSSSRSSPPSRSARAPASGWTSHSTSSSKNTAAICGWNRCPATPGSSCCCRWKSRPSPTSPPWTTTTWTAPTRNSAATRRG